MCEEPSLQNGGGAPLQRLLGTARLGLRAAQ